MNVRLGEEARDQASGLGCHQDGSCRDSSLYTPEAFQWPLLLGGPGWEIRGAGYREEGGAPTSLPPHGNAHPHPHPRLGSGWGLPSGPGAGFPFPLTLIDRKLGLILMVGREALPLSLTSFFSCFFLLPALVLRRFREVSNS